jgi:hypothetical protein
MYQNKLNSRLFLHPKSHEIPLIYQDKALKVLSDVLNEIAEVKPYATISELLQPDDDEL